MWVWVWVRAWVWAWVRVWASDATNVPVVHGVNIVCRRGATCRPESLPLQGAVERGELERGHGLGRMLTSLVLDSFVFVFLSTFLLGSPGTSSSRFPALTDPCLPFLRLPSASVMLRRCTLTDARGTGLIIVARSSSWNGNLIFAVLYFSLASAFESIMVEEETRHSARGQSKDSVRGTG